jgi:hypothetical protein
MHGNPEKVSVTDTLVVSVVLLNAIVLQRGFVVHQKWYALLWLTVPLLLITAVYQRRRH